MIALFVLAGALLWPAQEARASAHSHVPEGASGPSCGRVFLAASDAAAFGRFGQSVAIEDDTLLVGAPAQPPPAGAGSGHVYTFVREGGLWQERDKVRAQGLAALFGTSVDLSGERMITGAPTTRLRDGTPAGAAYVFARVDDVWSEEATLLDPTGEALAFFGQDVAIDGDLALVGAPGSDAPNGSSGAAFVFARSANGWELEAKLNSPGPFTLAFGEMVALSGRTALIGHGGGTNAAWVFERGDGSWPLQAVLTSSLNGVGGLGNSVDLDGDRAVLGWPMGGPLSPLPQGRVLTYVRSGETWHQETLLDGSLVLLEALGRRVALSGGTLVAIGDNYFIGGDPPLRIFGLKDGGWFHLTSFAGTSAFGTTLFGESVAVDGSVVVVGAPSDGMLAPSAGAVWLFDVGHAFPPQVACRNAGTNPFAYEVEPASIGGRLAIDVNNFALGYGFRRVFGFDTPVEIPLAGGQIILCADQGGSGVLVDAAGDVPIPIDPALIGLRIFSQAILLFPMVPGQPSFLLTNAQDVVIGGCDG